MGFSRHSHVGAAAYSDLRRLALDDALSEVAGRPTPVTVKGRVYWYDKVRVGTKVAQTYLGEDGPEMRERLDRLAELKGEAEARRRERTRLVRILRAEGYASLDARTGSLLLAFQRAGIFRLGGTLVGTAAFRHYEAELGVPLGFDRLAQTDDIDIASFERLSVALDDRVSEEPSTILSALSFDPVPGIHDRQVWRWRQSSSGTQVEFLTAAFGDETVKPLPALGVSAQALHYLNYLIAEPIRAVALYRSGVLIQIPPPERYAIHKLIVADRRRDGPDADKSRKDRAQAEFLIAVLAEDRPDELRDAWEDARGRGPNWRKRLDATLQRMPRTREVLEGL